MRVVYRADLGDRIVRDGDRDYLIRTHWNDELLDEPIVCVHQQARWGGMFWRRVQAKRAAEIIAGAGRSRPS